MLPEVAAEALRFLSRRDLDRASAVSKWLDALIAQCFELYPLRPMHKIEVRPINDVALKVVIQRLPPPATPSAATWGAHHSFGSMDEAVHFATLSYATHTPIPSR